MTELPPNVRVTDPATSHAAAAPRRRSQRDLVMVTYFEQDRPMTAWEYGQATGLAEGPSCYWKRVSECHHLGLLRPTGEERPGPLRNYQQVLELTSEGVDFVEKIAIREGWR